MTETEYGGDQHQRNTQHDINVRAARREGSEARRCGKPIWLNPYTGLRARAWKRGWEEASPGEGGQR